MANRQLLSPQFILAIVPLRSIFKHTSDVVDSSLLEAEHTCFTSNIFWNRVIQWPKLLYLHCKVTNDEGLQSGAWRVPFLGARQLAKFVGRTKHLDLPIFHRIPKQSCKPRPSDYGAQWRPTCPFPAICQRCTSNRGTLPAFPRWLDRRCADSRKTSWHHCIYLHLQSCMFWVEKKII